MGKIIVAGIGPGSQEDIPPAVLEAVREADVIVGYKYYFQFIKPYVREGCECIDTGMKKERERAEQAFALAEQGKTVVVISSGDAGIYGMTPLIYEMKQARQSDISIEAFAQRVKEYIESKGNNHHVVFLVDEVGQYIGDDSRLMLNMQTITEDLGKICRGKVYESEILFDVVTDIASYNYEKRSSEGVIVPVGEDDELQVAFIEPLEINEENTRALRKFLEMTREGLALAIKGNELVGLVLSKESDSSIVIMGTNSWKYCKQGIPVFSVSNGKVSVSSLVSDETMVFSDEQRKRLPCGETIVTIAQEATHQKHGTTIIFTNEAETEAQRLSQYHRCERIDPIDLSQHKEIIMPLTSIDGALIVSLRGWCYAVGAILDGEAVKPGSIGRGARYNSALNYVAWRKQKSTEGWYCAVIISEDGISNIVTTDDVDKIDNGQLDF